MRGAGRVFLRAGRDGRHRLVHGAAGGAGAELRQVGRHQAVVVAGGHGADRIVQVGTDHAGVVLREERHAKRGVTLGGDRRCRLVGGTRAALPGAATNPGEHRRHHAEMAALHLGALRAQRLVHRHHALVAGVGVLIEEGADQARALDVSHASTGDLAAARARHIQLACEGVAAVARYDRLQRRLSQRLFAAVRASDRAHRLMHGFRAVAALVRHRHDGRHDHGAVVLGVERAERLRDGYRLAGVHRTTLADDERRRVVDHVAHDALGDASQGGFG